MTISIKKTSLFSHLRYIAHFAFPYKYAIGAGLITLIATDIGNVLVPWLLGIGIDSLKSSTTTTNHLLFFSALIVVVAFVRGAVRFGWRWYLMTAAQGVERDMRLQFFNHAIRLPIPFYARNRIGELLALSSNDLVAIRHAVGDGILTSVDFFVSLAGVLFFMFYISPELTCYALIPMPIITGLFIYFGPQIHARFTKVQESFATLTTDAEETISGLRVIRAYNQEEGESKRFKKVNEKYLEKNVKLIRIDATFHMLMFLIPSLIFPFILLIGGFKMIEGSLSIGDFIAFHMYVGQLVWPMIAIGWTFNIMQRAGASTERIREFFKEEKEKMDDDPTFETLLNKPIFIKNLTFYYPKTTLPALKNLTCTIHPNQTTAILGSTGSGKSTLFNLILRLYDPPKNTIFIGNIDILHIPKTVLRQLFAVAPQAPFLFTDSIAQNIIFAAHIKDEKTLVEAAQGAHIFDDIQRMTDKFETIVGERGTTLSGGQRQRTAIARAFCAKRPILMLDDPLSAVDTVVESNILKFIGSQQHQHTLIMITHRVCAAILADQLIILEKGELQLADTHEKALKYSAYYQEIASHQTHT